LIAVIKWKIEQGHWLNNHFSLFKLRLEDSYGWWDQGGKFKNSKNWKCEDLKIHKFL
jgi:hypothetical protein